MMGTENTALESVRAGLAGLRGWIQGGRFVVRAVQAVPLASRLLVMGSSRRARPSWLPAIAVA